MLFRSETEEINDQEVFTNFKRWLQSADGGQLDQRTAKQHHKQIIKLLGLVDGKKDLKSLYNPGLINEKFLESHAKIWKREVLNWFCRLPHLMQGSHTPTKQKIVGKTL